MRLAVVRVLVISLQLCLASQIQPNALEQIQTADRLGQQSPIKWRPMVAVVQRRNQLAGLTLALLSAKTQVRTYRIMWPEAVLLVMVSVSHMALQPQPNAVLTPIPRVPQVRGQL